MDNVSRNCDIGKHSRCLGTVLAFPPVDGQRIVTCQCKAVGCNHPAAAASTTGEAS